jgi:hypothetical protein
MSTRRKKGRRVAGRARRPKTVGAVELPGRRDLLEIARQRLIERFASASTMNANHLRVWGRMLEALGATLATQATTLKQEDLDAMVDGLAIAVRGIRLASEGGTK